MRQFRSSGSVEGVVSNDHSYSDSTIVRHISKNYQKNNRRCSALGLKKTFQLSQHIRVNPTFNFLTGSSLLYQARLAKLFYVMRNSGGHDLKVSCQIANASTLLALKTPNGSGDTTRDKAEKYFQTVWV